MNKLIWKLLRQHISLSQLAGFFFANLFGMWVVMLGIQFYKDIIPVFTEEDNFINNNFLVVSKHITTVGTLSGRSNAFSTFDIDDVRKQPFCKKRVLLRPHNIRCLQQWLLMVQSL